MISKLILDFVGGVIHHSENAKFSKPFNKTFIKKILDGKTNQNEYDNIKMFYSIIEHKKNIQNKIFNKTDTKQQIENIKTEILKNKCYVYYCNEDGKTEGHPAKIPVDKIKKNSFSEEEPQEKKIKIWNGLGELPNFTNTDNLNIFKIAWEKVGFKVINKKEKIEILDEEIKDEIENENEEIEILDEEKSDIENEVFDYDLEIKKMKEQKRLYDLKIKKMKEKQKQILRHQKIEKMKAQQKPNEKEQLRNLINNLNYQVDDEYKKDMINLLEKLKPINKQKKEKIILNKERNIKALKVDKSKRFVCPWCFGFRMDYNKFLHHINICKKSDCNEEKLDIIADIKDGKYNNFKCKTTEESIEQYNNKYSDELGYIEKY